MRIAYVLASPELAGGTKVVFQHADLLEEAGEEVRILGAGPRPRWHSPREYHDLTTGRPSIPPQDLLIATYWTTLPVARSLELGPLAHFCQGYEGSFAHLLAERPAIERVYREPVPTLTVTPHLAALLAARFGRECRVASPPLDRLFRPRPLRSPRRRPWIAVPGIFEAAVKGVPTALAAIAELERRGLAARLLRISTHPISDTERAVRRADRELVGVPPRNVARALRGCDLLLLPSRAEEGFGLPLLEAMASGVPAVASRIPSTEFVAGSTGGAVALVDPEDPRAFADAAESLLRDRPGWQAARSAGIAAAERFAPERIGPEVRDAVRWAATAGAAPPAARSATSS